MIHSPAQTGHFWHDRTKRSFSSKRPPVNRRAQGSAFESTVRNRLRCHRQLLRKNRMSEAEHERTTGKFNICLCRWKHLPDYGVASANCFVARLAKFYSVLTKLDPF